MSRGSHGHWCFSRFVKKKGKRKGKKEKRKRKGLFEVTRKRICRKRKGKGKNNAGSTSVCWSRGKTSHFATDCPTYRVSAVEGEDQPYPPEDTGDWSHIGESDDWSEWTEWAINAVNELYNDSSWDLGKIHFGPGILGIPGILGVGLRFYFGRLARRPLLRRRPKLWRSLRKRLHRPVARQLCPGQLGLWTDHSP